MGKSTNGGNTKMPEKKGNGRTKGWRPNRKSKDYVEKDPAPKKVSYNDPNWYIPDGQLAKDVASISFNQPLGAPFTLSSVNYDSKWTLPGIMTILTMPTGGASTNPNSPINVAARKVYSWVRHENSGHANYDPADLMMYLLAMDSIYIFWAWMVRLYGLLQLFSQTNRYVGDALIFAAGGNASDLRKNMSAFRAYINMFAVKASTFAVPKTMPLFVRHSWMYTNVYKDEDVSKAQYYVYAPAAVYQWAPTISAGGSGLQPRNVCAFENSGLLIESLNSTNNTLNNISALGNQLIDSLMANEDIGIMSGDVLKAYGQDNIWRLETIPEFYSTVPVFSEEVLSQIHNTEITSRVFTDKDGNAAGLQAFTMFQDNSIGAGTIIQDVYNNTGSHMLFDKLIDFWKQDPTPEDVLVASRNMYVAERNDGSSKALTRNVKLTSYGSEVAVAAFMIKKDADTGLIQSGQIWANDNAASPLGYFVFNEAPIRLVMNQSYIPQTIMGEASTYAVLSRNEVARLHECALLAMFGVPTLR